MNNYVEQYLKVPIYLRTDKFILALISTYYNSNLIVQTILDCKLKFVNSKRSMHSEYKINYARRCAVIRRDYKTVMEYQ